VIYREEHHAEDAAEALDAKLSNPHTLTPDLIAGDPRLLIGTTTHASSRYRQNAFAIRICSGVRHSGSKSSGLPTSMQTHRARDVATLSQCRLNRNSMPCRASSGLDVAIE
jgi:hypothetical protein